MGRSAWQGARLSFSFGLALGGSLADRSASSFLAVMSVSQEARLFPGPVLAAPLAAGSSSLQDSLHELPRGLAGEGAA